MMKIIISASQRRMRQHPSLCTVKAIPSKRHEAQACHHYIIVIHNSVYLRFIYFIYIHNSFIYFIFIHNSVYLRFIYDLFI